MAYIRTKKINNHLYAYLVESLSTPSGPRQKVKQYLGRIYQFDKTENVQQTNFGKTKESIINALVTSELCSRKFKKKDDFIENKSLIYSQKSLTLSKKSKSKNKKEAIIKLNEGFLCSFTIQRILSFKKGKDIKKDGLKLAKYFFEAGLQIPKEQFVLFYQMIK